MYVTVYVETVLTQSAFMDIYMLVEGKLVKMYCYKQISLKISVFSLA